MVMAIAKGWIFSEKTDLIVFLGPTVLGLFLYLVFKQFNVATTPTPAWAIFLFLTAADSVHVFSTSLRTYLNKEEFTQRKLLYIIVPIICYIVGFLIYQQSSFSFWITLTYLNVIHIVRQQYGWMAYSNRKANGDKSGIDWKLDRIAIYNVTLFPLIWWHAHLPRPYSLQGEFIKGLPQNVSDIASVIFWGINIVYFLRQVQLVSSGKPWNAAKFIIWSTTFVTWYCAMILANSEFEFLTVGGLIHTVPYLALIFFYRNKNVFQNSGWILPYLGLLLVAIIHEQVLSFSKSLSPLGLNIIIPLVTLPYSMHYVLDAFIWKVNIKNSFLVKRLEFNLNG
jgi:hypothetical protein